MMISFIMICMNNDNNDDHLYVHKNIHNCRNYEKVQLILGENTAIHINEADAHGLTSLYNAALYNHTEICYLLLEMGADPNIANKNAEFPLHVACKSGNLELVKLLVRFGADVNFKLRGRSCLDLAVQGNFCSLVEYFLENHMSSLAYTTNESELELCAAPTYLVIAVSLNHIEIVRMLLDYLPSYNNALVDQATGKSCLMIAAERDYYKIVHLLLSRDGHNLEKNLSQRNAAENGWTCVHYAAVGNSAKCFQVISSYFGDNPSTWSELRDNKGRTPLHLASLNGHYELVRSLLEMGVRSDIPDNEGNLAQDLASATLHYHHVSKVFRDFAKLQQAESPDPTPHSNNNMIAIMPKSSDTLQRAMYHNSANSVTVAI